MWDDEWTDMEKEKNESRTYEDKIKALTAKLKEYTTAYTSRWSGPNGDSMEKKYAWKKVPPKNGDPSTKKVHVNGISKTYYWCPHHLQWTVHLPKECKRLPVGKGRKNQNARRQSRDHTSKKRRKLTFGQRQLMRHA